MYGTQYHINQMISLRHKILYNPKNISKSPFSIHYILQYSFICTRYCCGINVYIVFMYNCVIFFTNKHPPFLMHLRVLVVLNMQVWAVCVNYLPYYYL